MLTSKKTLINVIIGNRAVIYNKKNEEKLPAANHVRNNFIKINKYRIMLQTTTSLRINNTLKH